jgi:hypothetical protein
MTRRDFGAGVAEVAIATRTGGEAKAASTIALNPIRRRGVGLRGIDPSRASAGFTLFAPMRGDGGVYLVDVNGKIVHTWRTPYPPRLYGYLTDKGTLFYNGLIPNQIFIGKTPFRGGAVLEAKWNWKTLWELRHPNHHHDARLLKNGNVLLLCAKELPPGVVPKIRGGRVETTKEGNAVWEWRAWEHLDQAEFPMTAPQNERSEWTQGNSVSELPDGNLLVSFRHISSIVKIDRKSGAIVWKPGSPTIAGQHAPVLLRNGNILINGPHRVDQMFPFSRVIEVNPASNEIVWKYQEAFPPNFRGTEVNGAIWADYLFSDRISNAQRLPNGDTSPTKESSAGSSRSLQPERWSGSTSIRISFRRASPRERSKTTCFGYTEEEIPKARIA